MGGLWDGVKTVAGFMGPTGRAIATGMGVAEGIGGAIGLTNRSDHMPGMLNTAFNVGR